MNRDYVISADGTKISYLVEGSGPALLVVPGALTVAEEFEKFSRELTKSFTVYTLDRRGRGESGPQGVNYSIEKECEDVRAVQAKTGAEYIFGHSFGGFVVLEAARRNPFFKKVALYEPGISIDGSLPMGWTGKCQELLDQGKNLDAFIAFIKGLNPEMSGKSPNWMLRLILPMAFKKPELALKYELLPDTVREHAEIARLDNTFANYREIEAEVLLMYGGKPKGTKNEQNMQTLAGGFREKEVQQFPELDHFGPEKKPVLIAGAVAKFLLVAAPVLR